MILLLQIMIKGTPILKMFATSIGGLPSMTFALEGGSRKVDKSTDKLRDHVCDKGGKGVKKFEIFMDVIDGSPLNRIKVDLRQQEKYLCPP